MTIPERLNFKAIQIINRASQTRAAKLAEADAEHMAKTGEANREFIDLLESYDLPLAFKVDNEGKVTVTEEDAKMTAKRDPKDWKPTPAEPAIDPDPDVLGLGDAHPKNIEVTVEGDKVSAKVDGQPVEPGTEIAPGQRVGVVEGGSVTGLKVE